MEALAATHLVHSTMKFHQSFPDVDLTIQTAATGDLISKVLNEELDLAFVADPADPADQEELMITLPCREPISCLC